MAKIKKAIDWEGDFLNIYDQIERKDLSPSAIEHKWTPFGIKKEGTAVNAELLNDFQKNGIYGTLNTVKEIINSVERYIIKDFYGIEEFGVFEELKLKIKISDANNEDNPKLVLNSIEYSMIYSTETSFVNIKKGQLEKNKIYNLIFNGVAFIVESSSLKATADSSGLMSLSDIRKEIANLSGASYSGIFGSELKNIIVGNSYLYFDTNGKGIMYKALNTKTNASGFLVPNATDFADITNSNISRYESFTESRMVTGSNGVSIQLTFIFQKVGRVINFSIVNTSITPGVMFNDDSTIVDFNSANYSKFKPVQFGILQGGTYWIEEYPLIRTNTGPVNLYSQFNIARLVLMGNRMSIFGIGGLGTFDVMRVSGTYIGEL